MDNLVSSIGSTGSRRHTDLLQGSFTINCLARLGLEAEKLALLVAKAIKMHRRMLQQAGFFQIGQQISIGPESPAATIYPGGSDEDYVMVGVTFPCFWQETWNVTPSGLEALNSVKLTVQSITTKFDGSLLYPDSINQDGAVNEESAGVVIQKWTLTE